MKITGPGSGSPADAAGGVSDVSGSAGKAFAQKIEKADPAAQAASSGAPSPASPMADIAAELQGGKITPQAAVDRVLNRIVDQQVGVDAPPTVRQAVGAALRDALESDPLLVEKVRRLG